MEVKEWLGENNQIGIDIWERKYRYNNEIFEEWLDRVSGGNPALRKAISERKVLFGGRTLSNRGTNKKGSFSNCYSAGYVEDDMDSIMQTAHDLALTYKSQGGQGISLTKLRPKGTSIGNDYKSDGIVPFMEIFNTVTASVSQGGSRKGALMMSLDIRHKEAEEFITIKTDTDKINKANLSLEIDDKFMNAVQEYYINGNEITLYETRNYNGHIIEYDIVPIKLYKKMMEVVWDYGEPGCLFTERLRNYNLMEFIDSYEIPTTNPCGEQPLGKHLSCNLCSINLSEFVKNPYTTSAQFDTYEFLKTVDLMVYEMDKVLDENINNHALKEQKENSQKYRNIGIGIMGLGSALFKLGIKYGSSKAISFIENIMFFMFKEAVLASSKHALENGSFPAYEPMVFDSEIIKNHFTFDEIKKLKTQGLRNCSLLSIAPTGSIGTMLNIATGTEPSFSIHYTRRTDNLNESYDVYCKEAIEWAEINNKTLEELPDYFVCSADINWKDRINMQAELQKHVDTAISSTVNIPQQTTKDEIEQLYLYAWSKGLKGTTIFRDGCKRLGILTTDNKEPQSEESVLKLQRGDILEVNDDVVGLKRKITTGCGSLHCTAFFDPVDGTLLETYLSKGSSGGCNNFMIGLSRMISLASRGGVDIDSIIDQLNSCGSCPSYAVRSATKKDTSRGSCCPMAVGNALKDMWIEVQNQLGIIEEETIKPKAIQSKEKAKVNNPCPQCGAELQFSGGCNFCSECSYSKCD